MKYFKFLLENFLYLLTLLKLMILEAVIKKNILYPHISKLSVDKTKQKNIKSKK